MPWLADNPNLGLRPDEGKHVIFYRAAGSNIEIIGIPHQRMDIERQLGGDAQPTLQNPIEK